MKNEESLNKGRLFGRSIALLSGFPSNGEINSLHYDNYLRIEEAFISIVRAILSEKGKILFYGDPFFSMLLAFISCEYLKPRVAEEMNLNELINDEKTKAYNPIEIYNIEYQNSHFNEELNFFNNLGYLSISKDKFKNKINSNTTSAIVCIGGSNYIEHQMLGIIESENHIPIFTLSTTGGASNTLSKFQADNKEHFKLIDIDQEIIIKLKKIKKEKLQSNKLKEERIFQERDKDIFEFEPYSLITQVLIHKLFKQDQNRY
jgi:hypothetical protein